MIYKTNKQLIEESGCYTPGGVHSAIRKLKPVMAWKSGEGAYLWDIEGKRYIDYNAAWGAIVLGYKYPEVQQAVKDAVDEYDLYGTGTTPLEVKFSKDVCKHVPSVEKVLVCTSGSEATYHSIRVSRAYTGREKIIKFQGGFHGWHDYVLKNNYSEKIVKESLGSTGMLKGAVDNTLVCRFNDLDNVAETIRQNKDEVAAIIIEPIAYNCGCIMLDDDFLRGLRKLCDENGILLIFDEVITGFRVGMGGYQGICNVMPDLTCMGKAIANGYPLAALGGKKEIMDRFNTNPAGDVCFQGTYNAHPLCLAAAIATMNILERDRVHEKVFEMGEYFRKQLQGIFDRLGIEAVAHGFGPISIPLFARGPFRYQEDIIKSDPNVSAAFRTAMIERGYYIPPQQPKRIAISFSHTIEDIDETLQVAEDVLREMKKPSKTLLQGCITRISHKV